MVQSPVIWEISVKSTAHGTRQGHDIAATGPNGAPLYVECKGSTNEEEESSFRTQNINLKCNKIARGAIANARREMES